MHLLNLMDSYENRSLAASNYQVGLNGRREPTQLTIDFRATSFTGRVHWVCFTSVAIMPVPSGASVVARVGRMDLFFGIFFKIFPIV